MRTSLSLLRVSSLSLLLPLLLACLPPLRGSSEPVRLAAIGANRVVEKPDGQLWMQRGLLDRHGAFGLEEEAPVLSTVGVPPAARDQVLVSYDAWLAYARLGPQALIHFVADETGPRFTLGYREYLPVAANPGASAENGNLINLSTLGRAAPGEPLISGFVIDGETRRVLVRAVGPGLAPFQVSQPLDDPTVTIFRGSTPIASNDDWSTRPDATDISAAAAQVGAFALAPGSKDASLLLELAPGNYTAQVGPAAGETGTVLLEIYRVP